VLVLAEKSSEDTAEEHLANAAAAEWLAQLLEHKGARNLGELADQRSHFEKSFTRRPTLAGPTERN